MNEAFPNRKRLDDPNLTEFILFCRSKIGYKQKALVIVSDNVEQALSMKSMAAYVPNTGEIWILRAGRLRADWYRSLAHELVHHGQRERGEELDGSDGSAHENEANSMAGEIMRSWGREHPEIFQAEVKEDLARDIESHNELTDKGLLDKSKEHPIALRIYMIKGSLTSAEEDVVKGDYVEAYAWLEEAKSQLERVSKEIERLAFPD